MSLRRFFFAFLFPLAAAFLGALLGSWLADRFNLVGAAGWIAIGVPAVLAYFALFVLALKRGVVRQGVRIDV